MNMARYSVISVAIWGSLATSCVAQTQSSGSVQRAPVWDDIRITGLLREADLAALEAAATELRAKWKANKRPGIYGKDRDARYLYDVIGAIGNRSPERARAEALLVLVDRDDLPLEIELHLVRYLATRGDAFGVTHVRPSETWPQQRREDARYWLHAYRRLRDAIDPNWDRGNVDFVSPSMVRPPARYRGPWISGMSPKHIDDPEIRAEYEAGIADNAARAERYFRQSDLRKLRDEWLPSLESALVQAYIAPPEALPELKALLDEYKVDRETRARILHGVQTKTVPQKVIPSTQPTAPRK